jgi:hypothetical protein
MFGLKAKIHHAKRHAEKVQMKKTLKAHDERNVKQKDDGAVKEGALPTYLLDREGQKVSPTRRVQANTDILLGRQSSLIRDQGQTKRSRRQVRCALAQGPRHCRGGDVQGHQDGQAQKQELEADGQQGYVCWGGFHPKTGQAGGE